MKRDSNMASRIRLQMGIERFKIVAEIFALLRTVLEDGLQWCLRLDLTSLPTANSSKSSPSSAADAVIS